MNYQQRTHKTQTTDKKENLVLSSMVILSVLFCSVCAYSFHVEDKEHMRKCLERENSSYCYKTIYGWLTTKNFYYPCFLSGDFLMSTNMY